MLFLIYQRTTSSPFLFYIWDHLYNSDNHCCLNILYIDQYNLWRMPPSRFTFIQSCITCSCISWKVGSHSLWGALSLGWNVGIDGWECEWGFSLLIIELSLFTFPLANFCNVSSIFRWHSSPLIKVLFSRAWLLMSSLNSVMTCLARILWFPHPINIMVLPSYSDVN